MARQRGLLDEQLLAYSSENQYVNSISTDFVYDAKKKYDRELE